MMCFHVHKFTLLSVAVDNLVDRINSDQSRWLSDFSRKKNFMIIRLNLKLKLNFIETLYFPMNDR